MNFKEIFENTIANTLVINKEGVTEASIRRVRQFTDEEGESMVSLTFNLTNQYRLDQAKEFYLDGDYEDAFNVLRVYTWVKPSSLSFMPMKGDTCDISVSVSTNEDGETKTYINGISLHKRTVAKAEAIDTSWMTNEVEEDVDAI